MMLDSFYKTKKWKRKRDIILRRDEYTCQECKRYGKTIPATIIHHVFPLESFPDLKLVNDNLISLCNNCHEAMHNRFNGELTEKGIAWQNRMKMKSKALRKYLEK